MKQQIVSALPFWTCDANHCSFGLTSAKLADRKDLLPEVQFAMGPGTLVFRDASSLSGTLKMENGTSVTIGN
jgi:hypothetical protein